MADIKDRAREYIAKHSEYSEVFGQTFVAVDTLTAMVEFAEQETKDLKAQIEKMKRCEICKHYQEGSCNYHYYSQQVCKENGMKLFELKEIKEK